jgi:hypothetical protein
MNETDQVELKIEVSASDATDEELDRMTRQLLSELRGIDVESAELAKGGPVPAGAKGDPIAIGTIALEVLPAILPSVIGLVQAWVSRGQGRTVKFKGKVGKNRIEFEGSTLEFQQLLAMLEKERDGN